MHHPRSQHDSRQWRYYCIGYKLQPYSWAYILAHLQDSEFREHTRHKRLSHIVYIDILLPFHLGKRSPYFHRRKTRTPCHVKSIILADVSGNRWNQQKVSFMGSKGHVHGLWLIDFDPFIMSTQEYTETRASHHRLFTVPYFSVWLSRSSASY